MTSKIKVECQYCGWIVRAVCHSAFDYFRDRIRECPRCHDRHVKITETETVDYYPEHTPGQK